MADAGLALVSVSIDGLEATHDRMRHLRGSWAAGMAALDHLRAAGIAIASNINLNRLNHRDLEPLYDVLRDRGVRAWQVQLTAPLGRAADRVDLIFQPWDLLDVVPRIAALKRRALADGVTLMPGNNLGYFGPEETLLRSSGADEQDHWHGCMAGRYVMGIESDGAVKGCPSLQTAHYVGGNLRERPLAAIWRDAPALAFTRDPAARRGELWGICATCDFADVCLGGCSFTAQAITGRRGNNPYCHYRARTLAKRGQRERLVPRDAAGGDPFDNGTFEIVLEPLDAPDPGAGRDADALVRITRPSERARPRPSPARDPG